MSICLLRLLIIVLAVPVLIVRYKMRKQVVVCIAAAALVLLPTIFEMEGLCAEIPTSHITCNAGTYSAGTTAFVTCNFHKDMNIDKRPISVVRYLQDTLVDDPGTDVLLCQWQDRGQGYKCELKKGFSIDGNITDHLRLKLPADTGNFTGLYSCFIMHAQDIQPHACTLDVKVSLVTDDGVESTTGETNGSNFTPDKDKSSLLWLIILPVLLIGVVGAMIFYKCRLARNQTSNTTMETVHPPEIDPLICDESSGVSPKSKTPCQKECTVVDLSKTELKQVMNLFDKELTASLDGDAGTSLMTFVVSVQALPTELEKGVFLVVDFTCTNLKVHQVRLQDFTRKISSRTYVKPEEAELGKDRLVKGGSMSETYDIPEKTKLENGRELFDFIAKQVYDFMTEYNLFRKKFGLVFMLSFACEYDPDFSDARLTKWTKGFVCDGVVRKNLKELLQEALLRNKVPKTIRVVSVTNDTVGLLMSEAYRDPSCKIALSLMDGFRACYLQADDNQATANGNNHNQTKVATAHLGALGENDCVANFKTECDRRLDEFTVCSGEHTMEKMTGVLYIGEMVRLELLQQMEKGQIFASSPRRSSKLGDEGSIRANDVSLFESDGDEYLITKHLLNNLEVDYTEEDCKAVRSVCKAITKRAADLAAAGLATLINRLDHPNITVAIEGHMKEYHPGLLNQMEKRTKELVKPPLQFKLVRSQQGSSIGAALLAAAVSPPFHKLAPNTSTSGH